MSDKKNIVAKPTQDEKKFSHRRELTGLVVSDKMNKTIVVKVDRRVRHELYSKYVLKSVKYKAHDEKNEAKPGDQVVISECRALSREKRWRLKEISRKGQGQALTIA